MSQEEVYHSKLTMPKTCMLLAHQFALARSKDPRTKVGACVYDPLTGGMFLGYNGFPAGVPNLKQYWDNRESSEGRFTKYQFVRHAEANAINKAWQALACDVCRCELYVTHRPCYRCMVDFIEPSSIKSVFYAQVVKSESEADRAAANLVAETANITLSQLEIPACIS